MKSTTTTETDGIELEKKFEPTEFKLPSIVYDFTNTTDEDHMIRLSDSVPDSVEPENLGFHSNYGMDHWTIEGRTISFEYELNADSEYKTVIGIRREEIPEPEQVIQPIDSLDVEAKKSEKSLAEMNDSFTRSGSSDDGGADFSSTTNIEDPADSRTSVEETTAGLAESELEAESITDQFVAELRDGNVSEDQLNFLRSQIGTKVEPPRSLDARIKQLQQDLADLRAYRAALEGFLDEHGTADEVIDRFESQFESIQSEIDSLEKLYEEHEDKLSKFDSLIRGNEDQIAELSSEVSSAKDEIEEVAANLAEVDSQLPDYDVDRRMSNLDERVSSVESLQEKLKTVFAQEPEGGS